VAALRARGPYPLIAAPVLKEDLVIVGIELTHRETATAGQSRGAGRSETELWCAFELARPRILGALLDAAVRGLQTLPGVRLKSLPRMADFALWATACETALWPAGTF
jgi:hypothetical protein